MLTSEAKSPTFTHRIYLFSLYILLYAFLIVHVPGKINSRLKMKVVQFQEPYPVLYPYIFSFLLLFFKVFFIHKK